MKIPLVLAVLGTTALSGCIPYPVYKTLQPALRLTVTDAGGRPVQDAEVTLIARARPSIREQHRSVVRTGPDGTATFPAVREWRTEVLALHGSQEFFWNWCVRKHGHLTQASQLGSGDVLADHVVVQLGEGASTPCPPDLRGAGAGDGGGGGQWAEAHAYALFAIKRSSKA